MKITELRNLIKETVSEFLNETISDPTYTEMMDYLKQQFGNEEGFSDFAEVAIYWFARDYYDGQFSNLYSILCTSPFNPGPIAKGPEPNSMEAIMYDALETEFGGKTHTHGNMEDLIERALYKISCPKCEKEGAYIDNASNPTIFQCASCKHQWNPDNQKVKKPSKLGENDDFIPQPESDELKYDPEFIQQAEGDAAPVTPAQKKWEMMRTAIEKKRGSKEGLSEREIIVINLRFGQGLTYDEISKIFMKKYGMKKCTKETIRQIEARALRKLRHPDVVNPSNLKEEDWKDKENDPQGWRAAEETYRKDDANAFYVEYDSERKGENPFIMNGQKFQYVNAIYPSGKKDIGVYAFAGDLVYGYEAWRKRMGLSNFEESKQELEEDGAGGGQGGPGAPGTGMGNVTANVDPIRVPVGGGRKHPKDVPAHRENIQPIKFKNLVKK